jgi:hypothetical protein
MKKILIIMLIATAVIMTYLGIKLGARPPIFTGVGFVIIAALFLVSSKKD